MGDEDSKLTQKFQQDWNTTRLGLDAEHLTAWNAKIDAVTVEMVRALARRLMGPDALTFAIAGDPTGL